MVVRPKRITNKPTQHPNHTNPGYSNYVRIHADHNCELGCHDSSMICRGYRYSPCVAIILRSQASVDLMEYLYTLSGHALGHHYKIFQWFLLVCSRPTEVSPEVLIQNHQGPLLRHVVLRRVHSFTHSFPTRQICRESTPPAAPTGRPNYPLPHTTLGHTHIGS
jgi:hypothetical protein